PDSFKLLLPDNAITLEIAPRSTERLINLKIIFTYVLFSRKLLKKQISLIGLYVLAVARSVGARLVISHIDNNSWSNLFYFSNIRAISIQNGWRNSQDFRNTPAQDIYAGFHRSKPSELVARQYLGLGSFAIASSNTDVMKQALGLRKRVVYVSQFRPKSSYKPYQQIELQLASWSSRFASERELEFEICFNSRGGASHNIEEEVAFFKSGGVYIKGGDLDHARSTLEKVSSSRLVVNLWSTVAIESWVMGVPVLACFNLAELDQRDLAELEEMFKFFPSSCVLPRSADYDLFATFADNLLSLSNTERFNITKTIQTECCAAVPSHQFIATIRDLIRQIISGSNH
ncbi:MAG: hypothetical protein VW684_13935, partial [Betaproteobacteria bacterium]